MWIEIKLSKAGYLTDVKFMSTIVELHQILNVIRIPIILEIAQVYFDFICIFR